MSDDLSEIIKSSTFEIQEGRYIIAKVTTLSDVNKHFMVSRDKDEITVVTNEANLKDLNLIERNKDNYSLISLNVSVPFYSVGFLATVSGAIANAGMNILIVSTYSKDYIMVREDKSEQSKQVLLSLGFKETRV